MSNILHTLFIILFTVQVSITQADTSKISYFNGLLLNGKLSSTDMLGADFGSGELKFLVKDSETDLFSDFSVSNISTDHTVHADTVKTIVERISADLPTVFTES